MKRVIASLALVASTAIAPAVHAQTTMSDSELAHAVRVSFAHNGITTSHVFVFARGGQVRLIGWVPEISQITKAETVARSVSGVTSVDNWLGPDGGRI